jgi:hypothetical protein
LKQGYWGICLGCLALPLPCLALPLDSTAQPQAGN